MSHKILDELINMLYQLSYMRDAQDKTRTCDTVIPNQRRFADSSKATLTGIEPVIFGVTSRRDNRYATRPYGVANGICTRDCTVAGYCITAIL